MNHNLLTLFSEDYRGMGNSILLEKICNVFQIHQEALVIPENYQLTLDNTVKILAIKMRLR